MYLMIAITLWCVSTKLGAAALALGVLLTIQELLTQVRTK